MVSPTLQACNVLFQGDMKVKYRKVSVDTKSESIEYGSYHSLNKASPLAVLVTLLPYVHRMPEASRVDKDHSLIFLHCDTKPGGITPHGLAFEVVKDLKEYVDIKLDQSTSLVGNLNNLKEAMSSNLKVLLGKKESLKTREGEWPIFKLETTGFSDGYIKLLNLAAELCSRRNVEADSEPWVSIFCNSKGKEKETASTMLADCELVEMVADEIREKETNFKQQVAEDSDKGLLHDSSDDEKTSDNEKSSDNEKYSDDEKSSDDEKGSMKKSDDSTSVTTVDAVLDQEENDVIVPIETDNSKLSTDSIIVGAQIQRYCDPQCVLPEKMNDLNTQLMIKELGFVSGETTKRLLRDDISELKKFVDDHKITKSDIQTKKKLEKEIKKLEKQLESLEEKLLKTETILNTDEKNKNKKLESIKDSVTLSRAQAVQRKGGIYVSHHLLKISKLMKGLKTEGNYDKFIQSLDELRKLLEQLPEKFSVKKTVEGHSGKDVVEIKDEFLNGLESTIEGIEALFSAGNIDELKEGFAKLSQPLTQVHIIYLGAKKKEKESKEDMEKKLSDTKKQIDKDLKSHKSLSVVETSNLLNQGKSMRDKADQIEESIDTNSKEIREINQKKKELDAAKNKLSSVATKYYYVQVEPQSAEVEWSNLSDKNRPIYCSFKVTDDSTDVTVLTIHECRIIYNGLVKGQTPHLFFLPENYIELIDTVDDVKLLEEAVELFKKREIDLDKLKELIADNEGLSDILDYVVTYSMDSSDNNLHRKTYTMGVVSGQDGITVNKTKVYNLQNCKFEFEDVTCDSLHDCVYQDKLEEDVREISFTPVMINNKMVPCMGYISAKELSESSEKTTYGLNTPIGSLEEHYEDKKTRKVYTYCRLSDVLNGLTTKSFDTAKSGGYKKRRIEQRTKKRTKRITKKRTKHVNKTIRKRRHKVKRTKRVRNIRKTHRKIKSTK